MYDYVIVTLSFFLLKYAFRNLQYYMNIIAKWRGQINTDQDVVGQG